MVLLLSIRINFGSHGSSHIQKQAQQGTSIDTVAT